MIQQQQPTKSEHIGCLPALGCGVFVFLCGLITFIFVCLALKGLFN